LNNPGRSLDDSDYIVEVIAKPSISRIFGTKKIGPWSLALNHTLELEVIENAEF
jgi:hypothetical protein